MPKPLTLRTANVALRALLNISELELRTEPYPSAFLNGESEARFFGPTWEDVIRQAVIFAEKDTQSHITND